MTCIYVRFNNLKRTGQLRNVWVEFGFGTVWGGFGKRPHFFRFLFCAPFPYIQNNVIHHNHPPVSYDSYDMNMKIIIFTTKRLITILIQGADVDPFHMPLWRKVVWTIFFFIMVATADIGNIIGNIDRVGWSIPRSINVDPWPKKKYCI